MGNEYMTCAMVNPKIGASVMVSIGMPVFNGEQFVERAIEAILGQTYPYFELIISDNASTDRTEEICRRFVEMDSRIRYVRQSYNIGPAANFRFVLEAANHDRFIWAAADDWWDRDRLERLVKALHSEDAAVFGGLAKYVGERCYAAYTPMAYKKSQWCKFLLREEARCEKVYFIYGLMWRDLARNCFNDLEDGYCIDAIFCYRLLWYGNLKTIEGAVLHSVAHPLSTGAQLSKSFRYSILRLLVLAHPLGYYRQYVASTPINQRGKVKFILPFKMFASQVHLWWRAFRRIVLGRPFIHGSLPGGERLVRQAGL